MGVPETTQCEATTFSIRSMAMALAANEKEAYCARRDAIWYPLNIPVITNTVMARATQTSISVNAARPFPRGVGWLNCISGPDRFIVRDRLNSVLLQQYSSHINVAVASKVVCDASNVLL
jgi:hypothetical protein